ncbi:hypothetical protein Sru01_10710 [Sphaerisporangium rufum]|uniref:HTH merR-type domain-containing protein n=1 Tax=Sphaerisporangium rufum TaxID=1381558 RepID=A0A919QXS4_9ACTN|nr:MerR family transcriptional regulator [Sphaerisporangium rufum]GII76089.1 hypothetical protein Sru01_10710 [Sphaerisporangium rufum]
MSDIWTIAELAEHAAATLRRDAPPASGRVREVPNERLIRWYTTIGLLDPPLTRRGRVALYGRRHLLQLVAIKRRQAEGRSIAEIQAELAGATDSGLAAVARLPAAAPPAAPTAATPAATTLDGEAAAGPAPARPRFWADRPAGPVAAPASPPPPAFPPPAGPSALPVPPAPHAPATPPLAGPPEPPGRYGPPPVPAPEPVPIARPGVPAAPPDRLAPATPPDRLAPLAPAWYGRRPAAPPPGGPPPPAAPLEVAGLLHGVPLAPEVTLLIGGRPPGAGDVAALRRAAGPLLAALRDLGLAAGPPDLTDLTETTETTGAGGPPPAGTAPRPETGTATPKETS